MVPSEAYAGRRAGYERVLMPKEERNKWTAWRGLAGLCCSSLQLIPA